ncbi:MAG: orotidine-5'-phosphate decarboxylase [Candidatus Omnitrophota bacterium]|nr:MAG: orotidine-5'-phosphate decarboxylase [Candidatus Omnitrophota bacterium]
MRNRLIVALDVNSFDKAKKLVDKLSPYVNIFKVGSRLFTVCGPKIINYINKKRKKTFLDLKFFDIPNTVEGAVRAAAKYGVFMTTLHISGGFDMLKKAAGALKGKKKKPLLVGVTVLTSKAGKDIAKEVIKLALIAKKAKLDGVVCSPKETRQVKRACGNKFIVVNPGIRPLWAMRGDQRRVTTPEKAIENGADFIVVGRPIIKAKYPSLAAQKILEEMV